MAAESLLRQLDEIARRTELPFERRLADTAIWFHNNRDRIPREDLAKRLDFTEKTLDIVLELLALSLERMQHAESHPRRSSELWLPRGISVQGDVRRLG